MSCELKAVPVPMAGEKLPISNSRERACLRTCSPREGRMGRCAMSMLLAGLFAVALSLSSTLATAQQVCQKAGDNKGSNDPNAVLNWTLTTHVYRGDWINTGRHVVVRPKHGKVGFASDVTHFLYSPQSGFIGADSFVIQFDRQIFTTRERAHRVISFTINVAP